MKTKKVTVLLALLLAGVLVSAQTYMDKEDIRLEKQRLEILNQQIDISDILREYFSGVWTSLLQPQQRIPGYRLDNQNKGMEFNGYPSRYVEHFDETGERRKVVVDKYPRPTYNAPIGTPENGRKPVVP